MKAVSALRYSLSTVLVVCANASGQTNTFPASGNVGIGTTSPGEKLTVVSGNIDLASYAYLRVNVGNTKGFVWGNHDYAGALGYTFQDDLILSTNWHGVTGNTDNFVSGATYLGNDAISLGRRGIRFFTSANNPANSVPIQRMVIENSGNVGIGIESPLSKLDVRGGYLVVADSTSGPHAFVQGSAGVSYFGSLDGRRAAFGNNESWETLVADGGNVGIGTTTPGAKLEVMGDISLPSSSGNKQIFTWGPTDTNWRIGMSASPGFSRALATTHVEYLTYSTGVGQGFAVGVNGGESSFEILGSSHAAFFRGNVGIGTTNPTQKLSVNGTIRAKEVIVEASPWPDDVFAADYDLPTIDEVAGHIAAEGHLPGVPNAATVAEQGVAVGEMQKTLLRKVEELTLYVIAQEKRASAHEAGMHALTRENAELRAELETLKQAVNHE